MKEEKIFVSPGVYVKEPPEFQEYRLPSHRQWHMIYWEDLTYYQKNFPHIFKSRGALSLGHLIKHMHITHCQ